MNAAQHDVSDDDSADVGSPMLSADEEASGGASPRTNLAPAGAVLTVFFCGTDGRLDVPRTWIEFFYRYLATGADVSTGAERALSELSWPQCADEPLQFKMGFNGCGVDFGCRGVFFGSGLERHVERAVHCVDAIAARLSQRAGSAASRPVLRVNCVGLSRGAIGVALLCRALARRAPAAADVAVESCLFLFDAVPGNFIVTGKLDYPFKVSLANQARDLSRCQHVRTAVAVYPYQPLPAVACHAPLLFRFPPAALVDEQCTLGCHQGALFIGDRLEQRCSFLLIADFLAGHGTALDRNNLRDAMHRYQIDRRTLLVDLNEQLAVDARDYRECHSPSCFWIGTIRRHRAARYLNAWHRNLAAAHPDLDPSFADDSNGVRLYQLELRHNDTFSYLHLFAMVVVPVFFVAVLVVVVF